MALTVTVDYEIMELGDVELQSGVILPGAFLAYKTYGTLRADKSNAILYPTAFGDTHVQNEWLIGEGKALDPQHYFIIVPNLLGNGLSSSPSNTPSPWDQGNFPQVTIIYTSLDAFLSGFWDRNFAELDPYNLLSMLWTGQHADISANPMYNGDFEQALRSIKARAVVMPASTDLYFTPEDSEYETRRMPNAAFRPIRSIWGHFAGRGLNPEDSQFIDDELKRLLACSVSAS